MVIQSLDSDWTYQEIEGDHSGKASVPGTIHTDLLANNQIEDPYYRTNEKDLQWIDKKDWIYQTDFIVDETTINKDRVIIQFEGLDTYADVYLNGNLILTANNMHREWVVEVAKYIKEGENNLKIYLHSPVKKGLELYNQSPYPYPAGNDQSERGGLGNKKISVFTRKAGYHYGWDWGPRFVTSGIWRPVKLISWNQLNIQDLYIKQISVSREKAILEAIISIDSENDTNAELKLANRTEDKSLVVQTVKLSKGINEISIPYEIDNPRLWWSNGLGNPEMYSFEVEVSVNGEFLDSKKVSTGLRSVKLIREADSTGESFLFELNGVRVFAKGANYIPNDVFLPRVTKADYEKLIADAAGAHMNMLRIWGGGVYENNYFYELCDQQGIMVWQDFMFACSMYPGDDSMLANIEKEAIDNVKRLRNHPSIVLWCGNNEINVGWHQFGKGGWGWKERYTEAQRENIYKAYSDIFHEVLPRVIEKYSNQTDYWPSSPQSGYAPDKHAGYATTSGDMHYWGVWHGSHRFSDFDKYKARFMSEYGFQSFPDFETVQKYTLPGDYDIESEVMSAHQRSGIGNLRIKEYLGWYYNVPDDFEDFLYMSQVLQAHGIRKAIEAHRRAMPYCMGSLYWQLNDCWPVASWSSTDYYHKWKALHYTVKHAYEPVILSSLSVNDEVRVFVVSDLLEDKKAQLQTRLLDFQGNTLYDSTYEIVINRNTSTQLKSVKTSILPAFDKKSTIMVLSISGKGKEICSKYHYFTVPKDLKFQQPDIDIGIEETEEGTYLLVTAATLTRDLYLYNKVSSMTLEENYFDLLPRQTKRIKIKESANTIHSKDILFRSLNGSSDDNLK